MVWYGHYFNKEFVYRGYSSYLKLFSNRWHTMHKTRIARDTDGRTLAATRRPASPTDHSFRGGADVRENRDCILITNDILDAFRDQVFCSKKVTLKFNSLKHKEGPKDALRDSLPNFFSERIRAQHGKSHTSLDFGSKTSHRPVRVFMDDVIERLERAATLDVSAHQGTTTPPSLATKPLSTSHNTSRTSYFEAKRWVYVDN